MKKQRRVKRKEASPKGGASFKNIFLYVPSARALQKRAGAVRSQGRRVRFDGSDTKQRSNSGRISYFLQTNIPKFDFVAGAFCRSA